MAVAVIELPALSEEDKARHRAGLDNCRSKTDQVVYALDQGIAPETALVDAWLSQFGIAVPRSTISGQTTARRRAIEQDSGQFPLIQQWPAPVSAPPATDRLTPAQTGVEHVEQEQHFVPKPSESVEALSKPAKVKKASSWTSADWWSFAFYGLALSAAMVGMMTGLLAYAGETFLKDAPTWTKLLALLPVAGLVETAGVSFSAQGDARRRLGEAAYGWRVGSLLVAAFAVVFNWYTHEGIWQFVFPLASGVAYVNWLLHSAGRVRDALRADSKLAGTKPDYGFYNSIFRSQITRRAQQLAVAKGLDMHDAWEMAIEQVAVEEHHKAIGRSVQKRVRKTHPRHERALIKRTLQPALLGQAIANEVNYTSWGKEFAAAIQPGGEKK